MAEPEKIEPAAAQPSPVAAAAPEAVAPAASPASPMPESAIPAPVAAAEPVREPTLLEKFAEGEKKPEPAKEASPEAKPAEKAAEAPKPEAKAETKPEAEVKPEAKVEPEKPAAPEKPAPVEYKYTLPETLKMDDALKGKVHAAFDDFRADPAQGAQKLFDLYAEQRAADAEQAIKNQFDVFNKTKAGWEKDWLADPEIGGAGHMTAMGAIARARDLGLSSAKPGTAQYAADRAAFDQFLAVTGAGSHPVFGKLLHNLARFIDEPQASQAPTEIRPTKTNGRAPKSSLYSNDSLQKMESR